MSERLIQPPESTDRAQIEDLAYVESRDEVVGKDYAYAAWKETDTRTGKWRLRIQGTVTAHTNLDPFHPSVRSNMAKAAVAGQMYSVFGFQMKPRDDDARLVENRLHFDEELRPQRVTIHLVTRNGDGTPKEEQTAEFPWPAEPTEPAPVLVAPKSSDRLKVTELAYVNSYDPFIDRDYAYLAYTERNPVSGKWSLKIKAKSTVGASLDPAHPALKAMIDKAADAGEEYAIFGGRLEPKEGDPRKAESRLYFDADRKPVRVEIEVVTRRIDGTATEPQIVSFDWPG
jgi:hypothetical protein